MTVRHALLALLADQPEYGFALKKGFEHRTAELWPLNVGQVYTTLSRLVRDGLVSEVVDLDAAADAAAGGPVSGDEPQRRYELTQLGREELASWIADPRPREVPDRDELVIKLALSTHLPGVDLQTVIDDQRRVSTEALQRLTRRKASLDESLLGELFAIDAAILQIDAELRWLDLCEARLAAADRARPGAGR